MTPPIAAGPSSRGLRPSRAVAAVLFPLVAVAAAYALWWLSDRRLYIGLFDRATFGWLVVVPVWLSVPLVSAVTWRGLTSRGKAIAATTLGVIIGGAAALLLWQATASPDCQLGAARGAEAWIGPALVVGVLIGGGLAASSISAANTIAAGRIVMAVATGIGIQLGFMVVAILTFTAFALTTPACQRPI